MKPILLTIFAVIVMAQGTMAQVKPKNKTEWHIKTFNKDDHSEPDLENRLKTLVKNGFIIKQVVPEPGCYGNFYTIIAY